MIKYEKCSPYSCYVTINGFVIYLEVSGATSNVPMVDYWKDEYYEEGGTHMVPEKEDEHMSTRLKLKWKRANDSGQVMSQCGRYWFGSCYSDNGLYHLWHDDTGEHIGAFPRSSAKEKAQQHLDAMREKATTNQQPIPHALVPSKED